MVNLNNTNLNGKFNGILKKKKKMLLTLWREIPFWTVGRIQRKKVREFRNISEGEGKCWLCLHLGEKTAHLVP